jgi:hypothetical protein
MMAAARTPVAMASTTGRGPALVSARLRCQSVFPFFYYRISCIQIAALINNVSFIQ